MTQFVESHTIEEMVKSIAAYFPGGELFTAALIKGTNLNDLLRGIGFSLLDAENFLKVYNSELIPDTGNAFIPEWESTLGIPDGCFPGSTEPDIDVRRLHVLVKLASLGVQTSLDFINLATILGFPDILVESGIKFGITPLADARFTIVVSFPTPANNIFPLNFPIPFGAEAFAILECLFTRLKPANCDIKFELQTSVRYNFEDDQEYLFENNVAYEF